MDEQTQQIADDVQHFLDAGCSGLSLIGVENVVLPDHPAEGDLYRYKAAILCGPKDQEYYRGLAGTVCLVTYISPYEVHVVGQSPREARAHLPQWFAENTEYAGNVFDLLAKESTS